MKIQIQNTKRKAFYSLILYDSLTELTSKMENNSFNHLKYDLIVFGATGYTGKNVVQYVARSAKEIGGIRWAISGRDESKLRTILSQVPEELKNQDTGVIVCDVNDELSLQEMANKGKIVLNCVGPYRFSGDAVVKACLAKNVHHIDVSGEPQYLETMQLRYHKEAKDRGVYIIGACGFDSVPSDVGASLVHKAMGGPVNTIETYLELGNTCVKKGAEVNFATWQSAIYGFAHADELKVREIWRLLKRERPMERVKSHAIILSILSRE